MSSMPPRLRPGRPGPSCGCAGEPGPDDVRRDGAPVRRRRWTARARAAAIRKADDELAGLVGRARSPAGDAEAVVDSGGALASLRLADSVTRLPATAVGALIVATAHAAATEAMHHRQRVLDALLNDLGDGRGTEFGPLSLRCPMAEPGSGRQLDVRLFRMAQGIR
jgi:hypothetical protein